MYSREIKEFRVLNRVARSGGAVLFGSSFARSIPVGELRQAFDIGCRVYNRSLTDLSVFDAEELLDDCVLGLFPDKVLLQLGETDIKRGSREVPEIIEAYERIIARLKAADKRLAVVVISVCADCRDFNGELELMARRAGCRYADITPAFYSGSPQVNAFGMLRLFIPDRLTFCDAMAAVNI